MQAVEHIVTLAVVCGSALFFAAMAWASQHQS
jgi:hypothetical protein